MIRQTARKRMLSFGQLFVDIFADAKSIYPSLTDSIYLRMQIRYDINPLSPRRAYRRCSLYRTPQAYIENPLGIYIEF